MASFLNFGSYQRYKEDTAVFLEWLAADATISGFILPLKENFPTSNPAPNFNSESKSHAEKLREKAAKKAAKREEKKSDSAPKPTAEQRSATPYTRIAETTSEVLQQAKAIAENVKIQVPENVVKATVRAIRARKRFADWFTTNEVKNGHSDDGHRYFIWILEEALRILRLRIPENLGRKPKTARTAPSHSLMSRLQRVLLEDVTPVSAEDADEIEDVKDMNEILDESSDSPPSFETSEEGKETPSNPKIRNVRHNQNLDTFDDVFAVYCFFEDMHKMQDFLGETWRAYKNQETDLTTASFITTAAIDIVKREGRNLACQLFPGVEGVPWWKMVALISDEGYTDDEAALKADQVRISSHGRFIFASPALSLARLRRHFVEIDLGFGLFPPFKLYCFGKPELDKLPETAVLEAEYRFLAHMMIESEQQSFLEPMFPEMASLLSDGKIQYKKDEIQGATLGSTYIPDEFNRGMRRFSRHGILDVGFVFTSRIILDIQGILKEHVAIGSEQLNAALETAKKCFSYEFKDPEDPEFQLCFPKSFQESELEFVMRVRQSVLLANEDLWSQLFREAYDEYQASFDAATRLPHSWEALDYTDRGSVFTIAMLRVFDREKKDREVARAFLEEYGSMPRNTPIGALEDESILNESVASYMPIGSSNLSLMRSHNPTLCGLDLLELDLKMERVRLASANLHKSIFLMAHLYNAAKQTGALGSSTFWPDMDNTINTHIHTIFAGELPTKENQFMTTFLLKMGHSPREWCVHGSRRKSKRSKTATRPGFQEGPQLLCSKVSSVFRELYAAERPISMERCIFLLNQQIPKTSESKRNTKTPQLNAVELLRGIRDWLHPEMQQMKFDYMKLDKLCGRLLKRIRLTCLVKLKVDYPTIIPPGYEIEEIDPQEIGYVMMAQNILYEVLVAKTFAPGETKRSLGVPIPKGAKRPNAGIAENPLLNHVDRLGRETIIFPNAQQLKLVGKVLEEELAKLKTMDDSSDSKPSSK